MERNKVNEVIRESNSPTETKGHRHMSGSLNGRREDRGKGWQTDLYLLEPASRITFPKIARH